MSPQLIEATREEGRNSAFDGGGLLLEGFFARRKEEDELGVSQSLEPFRGVAGGKEDVTPNGVFK